MDLFPIIQDLQIKVCKSSELFGNTYTLRWVQYSAHSSKLTQPWKIHHFDGIKQEKEGISIAMLVSGSVYRMYFLGF